MPHTYLFVLCVYVACIFLVGIKHSRELSITINKWKTWTIKTLRKKNLRA